MISLLDNIFWHALTGPQSRFSSGTETARRYARGFSPILGFKDKEHPDFKAIEPFCQPGEHFYCDGWSGAAPDGWTIDVESRMFKMVWAAPLPEPDSVEHDGVSRDPRGNGPDVVSIVRLGAEHAGEAFELAQLTRPGPFGMRTIELGEYFGVFDGQRLIAMAGERSEAGSLREISGICTHPDFQGRGLARRLTLMLIRRQMQRGLTPVLHVMHDNAAAHRLYAQMGFEDYKQSVVRVVSFSG